MFCRWRKIQNVSGWSHSKPHHQLFSSCCQLCVQPLLRAEHHVPQGSSPDTGIYPEVGLCFDKVLCPFYSILRFAMPCQSDMIHFCVATGACWVSIQNVGLKQKKGHKTVQHSTKTASIPVGPEWLPESLEDLKINSFVTHTVLFCWNLVHLAQLCKLSCWLRQTGCSSLPGNVTCRQEITAERRGGRTDARVLHNTGQHLQKNDVRYWICIVTLLL